MNLDYLTRQLMLARVEGNHWKPLCMINWRNNAPTGLPLQMWGRDFMWEIEDPMGKGYVRDCGDPWTCKLPESVCECKGRRCTGCYRRTENICEGSDCESVGGTFNETTEWCSYEGRALCDNCAENCGMCPFCYAIARTLARERRELRRLAHSLFTTHAGTK